MNFPPPTYAIVVDNDKRTRPHAYFIVKFARSVQLFHPSDMYARLTYDTYPSIIYDYNLSEKHKLLYQFSFDRIIRVKVYPNTIRGKPYARIHLKNKRSSSEKTVFQENLIESKCETIALVRCFFDPDSFYYTPVRIDPLVPYFNIHSPFDVNQFNLHKKQPKDKTIETDMMICVPQKIDEEDDMTDYILRNYRMEIDRHRDDMEWYSQNKIDVKFKI